MKIRPLKFRSDTIQRFLVLSRTLYQNLRSIGFGLMVRSTSNFLDLLSSSLLFFLPSFLFSPLFFFPIRFLAPLSPLTFLLFLLFPSSFLSLPSNLLSSISSFFLFDLDLLPSLPRILSYVFSFFLDTSPFSFCSSPFHLLHFFMAPLLFFPSFAPPTHSKSNPLPLKHGKVEKSVCGGTLCPPLFFFIFLIFFRFFLSPPTFSLLSPLFFFFLILIFSPPSHEFSLMSSHFFFIPLFFFLLLSLPPSPLLFGSPYFLSIFCSAHP